MHIHTHTQFNAQKGVEGGGEAEGGEEEHLLARWPRMMMEL